MNSELNSVKNTHRNLDKISNRINENDDVIMNNLYTNKNKNISNNEKLNTVKKPISQTFIKGTRTLKPKKEVKFYLNSTDKIETNSLNLQQII